MSRKPVTGMRYVILADPYAMYELVGVTVALAEIARAPLHAGRG